MFGLGDTSYVKFNWMAQMLKQRLLNLGATLFHEVGLGDFQHDFGYEGEFDPWMAALWGVFKNELSDTQMILKPEGDAPLPAIYGVKEIAPEV